MAVSIAGLIIIVVIIIAIIIVAIQGFTYQSTLNTCETEQSLFCYTITCPCDDDSQGPCFGYAKRPAETDGQWYCANAPRTAVDNNGNIAS